MPAHLSLQDADLLGPDFGPDTPLGDAGLDSLDMLKLAGLISESVGLMLPSTIIFDYPTVEALCDCIVATQVGWGGVALHVLQVEASAASGLFAYQGIENIVIMHLQSRMCFLGLRVDPRHL